ncbi:MULTISPECIES: alpha/beta hydrolase [Mycolicibacter]|uniref:Alpha/beta hydrolase n=1 Tax=Mycolicibacter virginiensis TaxID=1795032 RepID=A0A9X7NY68_9MYCO|nr:MULTISPECIES: alpha/beta hydrolase [Mycobacteriaceae]OBG32072.1 lipase [Mycolicibacter heraklionensis]OBJ28959.1 lipase [Mycolicibacter heraklionensis]PQM51727.1 alpha/beta hydrolase [Mycolicibacter virginiensis]ULP46193.1 alpha/beta hydrolase [Mycolicibacter virginiensis]
MTRSLPGGSGSGRGARWTEQLQSTLMTVGMKVTPMLPIGVQRIMTGGRAVTIDGKTLDPTLRLTLAAQRAMGVNGLVVGEDAVASRAKLRETSAGLGGGEIHVDVRDIVLPGPAGDIAARHYRPVGGGAKPLLVFYHGGGFVIGDLDSHDAICRLTCRDGDIAVLSVDYRLAPEHPAPAAFDDALAAFRWAHDHAAELGGIAGRVAVGGDSAGGNLAAAVALRARDEGGPAPVLQWLIYPVTDCTAQTRSRTLYGDGFLLTKHDIDWFTDQYVGRSQLDPTDPLVSPLLAGDLSGLPPALVAVAGFDPLHDEGEAFAAALRKAGVVVDLRQMPSLTHAFINLFPLGGGSATATSELISALRAHLSRG